MSRDVPMTPRFPSIEPAAVSASVRRQIAARYGAEQGRPVEARCYFCGTGRGTITVYSNTGWVHFGGLHLRRIIPFALGGSSEAENIVLACRGCRSPRAANLLRALDALERTP